MLKKIRLKHLILIGVISISTMGSFNISANANNLLPYKTINEVKYVNIIELAKLKGGQIIETEDEVFGKGYTIYLNGKLIDLYENANYFYIDGRLTTYSSERVNVDNMDFKLPVLQKPQKEGNDFLLPVDIVENKLGIKCSDEGVVINKENKNNNKENIENLKENNKNINNTTSNNTIITDNIQTAISFSELATLMPSLGFDEMGAYRENGQRMCVSNVTDEFFAIGLEKESPTFNATVKKIFNMLLPTQGDRLYEIVSNPFKDQVLEMDGRLVEIKQYPQGVSVNITNK